MHVGPHDFDPCECHGCLNETCPECLLPIEGHNLDHCIFVRATGDHLQADHGLRFTEDGQLVRA